MKKTTRRAVLDEFKPTADGNYVYTGKRYRYGATAGIHRKRVRTLLLFAAGALAATVGSGCINAAGMNNTFYVILPYIAEVAALFALCWQSGRLAAGGGEIREYVLCAVQCRLPLSALLQAVFAGIGFLSAGIYLILHGFEGRGLAAVCYLALKLAVIAVCLLLRRWFQTLEAVELL